MDRLGRITLSLFHPVPKQVRNKIACKEIEGYLGIIKQYAELPSYRVNIMIIDSVSDGGDV